MLFFALLTDTHELVEQNGAFLFGLDFVGVVFAELGLHKVAHLSKFGLRLRLKTFDEVGHLNILFLCVSQFVTQVNPDLVRSLLLTAQLIVFISQVSELLAIVIILDLDVKQALLSLVPLFLVEVVVALLTVEVLRFQALDLREKVVDHAVLVIEPAIQVMLQGLSL